MLLQANMVKRLTAAKGGDLEAKTGESLRVKGIECIPSAADDYLTISVDRVTLAYYRVKGQSGNQLGTLHDYYQKGNIMDFLTAQGVNVTLPIAEGQTLNITRADETGDVVLIYDRFSAGDVKETDPNGSASSVYTFMQYANIGTTPTASGDQHIDTAVTPAEFPDFPCGKVVPALTTIELLGIAAAAMNHGYSMGARFVTEYLKMVRNREVLFDTDRNGIPFQGIDDDQSGDLYRAAFSLIGSGAEFSMSNVAWSMGTPQEVYPANPGKPLMFDPALKFNAGEELSVYLNVTKTGVAVWTPGTEDIAFILRVRKS